MDIITYVLKLPTGGYASTHYFDENGNSICGCGAKASKDMLEKDTGLLITHQECINANKKRKKPQGLIFDIKVVHKAKSSIFTKKKYPFSLPPDVRWVAMDGDGDWVGFLNKPVLVEIDGSRFWTDQKINTKFYIFGKYPEYRKFSKIEETLEEI